MIRRSHHFLVCLATIAAAGCSGGGGGAPKGDRTDRDILVKNLSGPTTEAGGIATFEIVLRSRPAADVILDLSSDNTGEGVVTPAQMTFTPLNFNAPQTVFVTGQDDLVDDGEVLFHVVVDPPVSNDEKYAEIAVEPIPITNLDNETAGIYAGPPSGATTEEGGTAMISVRLLSAPTADVTIPVASEDVSEGDIVTDSIVFTALNWATAQNVTIAGVDDDLADGITEYGVTIDPAVSTDPSYDGLVPTVSSFLLTNIDDDTPGVLTTAIDTVTSESAGTSTAGSFTLRLTSEPAEDVVITIDVDVDTEAVVTTGSMTFTPANWNVARAVTVVGLDDLIADGHQPYQVDFMPTQSNDPAFDGLTIPSIDFVNLDNEAGGITVAPLVGVTTETGNVFELTVVLDGEPAADVTVNLESSDPSEGIASPSSLTFTNMNWDEPQTVTVSGVADGKRDGNVRYWITFAPAVTDDPVYAGIKAQRVNATNVDDADLATVVIFDDGLPTHATLAVDTSGAWAPIFASDSASFEAALPGAAAVIVELSSLTLDPSTEAALASFVSGGGRAIITYHDLDGATALQAALGLTASAPHTTYRNVFQNPFTDPKLFTAYGHPIATVLTGSDVVGDNGHELTLTGAGSLPGRFDSATGPGAIAVTNDGRVIVHGFAPDDADATDVDGDSRPDVLELYENELEFLTAPPGARRFDVNTAFEIVDVSTVTSEIPVTGFVEGLLTARVSFYITHTDVTDLDMLLIAPDGTAIDIASDRGGTGQDAFGTGCNDDERTLLTDDASLVLSTSSADFPYVGAWKPEQAFVNLQGVNPNGTWTLSVTDDGPADVGFVECWSLFLE